MNEPKPLLSDIRLWIGFFFLLRLYGIMLPPLEVAHNWRQTDGLMIARNFYEVDPNIMYPRVDIAGIKSGVVGCEFPILNFMIYILSLFAGYEHWYGRLIVLTVSSIGVYFFYRIIKRFFSEETGFNSAIVLTVSLWFSYSRKNIPDAFAVSLCLISLYHAFRYAYDDRKLSIIWFFVFASLGCLSKILAATLLTVLIFVIFDREVAFKTKMGLSICAVLIFACVCYWYFAWVPFLNNTYGFEGHFFMGLRFDQGVHDMLQQLSRVTERVFVTPAKYLALIFFIVSIILLWSRRKFNVLYVSAVPYFSFLILLIYTGASVVHDRYYMITLVPVIAFIIGAGLNELPIRKYRFILLTAIAIENLGDQYHDFRIRQPYAEIKNLESVVDQVCTRTDLVAITSGAVDNPMPMYFAHRRGWAIQNESLNDSTFIEGLQKSGCKYIIILKRLYGDATLNLRLVYDSEHFKIYQLGGNR